MLNSHFQTEMVVDQPREVVFAYVTAAEYLPQWTPGILEYAVVGEGPLRIGAEVQTLQQFMGRRVEVRERVVDYAPPWRYAVQGEAGRLTYEAVYLFDPAPSGTRVSLTIAGLSQGWFRLAEPFLFVAAQRWYQARLERLKAVLETATVAV